MTPPLENIAGGSKHSSASLVTVDRQVSRNEIFLAEMSLDITYLSLALLRMSFDHSSYLWFNYKLFASRAVVREYR
jgi:hypothetical protein